MEGDGQLSAHSPGFSFFICTLGTIAEDFMLRLVCGPLYTPDKSPCRL